MNPLRGVSDRAGPISVISNEVNFEAVAILQTNFKTSASGPSTFIMHQLSLIERYGSQTGPWFVGDIRPDQRYDTSARNLRDTVKKFTACACHYHSAGRAMS